MCVCARVYVCGGGVDGGGNTPAAQRHGSTAQKHVPKAQATTAQRDFKLLKYILHEINFICLFICLFIYLFVPACKWNWL